MSKVENPWYVPRVTAGVRQYKEKVDKRVHSVRVWQGWQQGIQGESYPR